MGFVDQARVTMMSILVRIRFTMQSWRTVLIPACRLHLISCWAVIFFPHSKHLLSELFVQNLKSVFYQVEEFIISQISEIVDGVANGRYSMVILKVLRYSFRKALKMPHFPTRTAFYQAYMKSQYNEGTTISSPPFEAEFVKKSAYSVSDKSLMAKRSLAYLKTFQSIRTLILRFNYLL
ncbi:Hypothetical_protein [Hexamita inflata]|uniref:Hypothetical_protein n=1 Tax=Hexamita inflata TaxID=28002 RepID=A0AA86P1E6_9EUKA|nr:Hypothetical protein HINF_LOCUS17764 [Hexamita inflata]